MQLLLLLLQILYIVLQCIVLETYFLHSRKYLHYGISIAIIGDEGPT